MEKRYSPEMIKNEVDEIGPNDIPPEVFTIISNIANIAYNRGYIDGLKAKK